ncbi:hypothetical protein Q604_UNBC15809G0001, partial [human gut metagenome]
MPCRGDFFYPGFTEFVGSLDDGGHPPASRNGHPSHVASLQR